MLVSTEIASFKQYGSNEEILKMLKDAGFDAYDFSMFLDTPNSFIFDDDYLGKARKLRQYADGIGIVCNQMHAPFPTLLPDNPQYAQWQFDCITKSSGKVFPTQQDSEKEYNQLLHKLVERALEIGQVLGAKICVVHPFNDFDAHQNAKMYGSFENAARKTGVKIALENMWNWKKDAPCASAAACSHHDDFAKHLSLLDENIFVACLDVGHGEMDGLDTNCVQMINSLGNRLQCLHWHDNDLHNDLHEMPFTNKINFDAICKALAATGYNGDVTLECGSYPLRFEREFLPMAARHMSDIAHYLRAKILQYKAEMK